MPSNDNWRQRALRLWYGPIPEEPVNWRSFYIQLRHRTGQHLLAGQFLSIAQLQIYIDTQTQEIAYDAQDYSNIFRLEYSKLLSKILDGVILTDYLPKYRQVLDIYRNISTTSLDTEFLRIQSEVGKEVARTAYLRVVASNGGWSILVRETSHHPITADLLVTAVESNDLAHYLLIEKLLPPDVVVDVPAVISRMLSVTPQHLGFFLQRFPQEVTSQIHRLVTGQDVSLLTSGSYNQHTRKFFDILLPYTRWNPKVLGRLQEDTGESRMIEYLGLDR
jgi:hypothetical protein